MILKIQFLNSNNNKKFSNSKDKLNDQSSVPGKVNHFSVLKFAHYQDNSFLQNFSMPKLKTDFLFTHNTNNKNSPTVLDNYFLFYETSYSYQTVNSVSSIYVMPTGSLILPIYVTESVRSSLMYICSTT